MKRPSWLELNWCEFPSESDVWFSALTYACVYSSDYSSTKVRAMARDLISTGATSALFKMYGQMGAFTKVAYVMAIY